MCLGGQENARLGLKEWELGMRVRVLATALLEGQTVINCVLLTCPYMH